ncbi:hypothetical protein EI94DRAFT_1728905 [Lactarius quietus]|nr:hypothetical protein EI94DRAFT_1728905 [Lactarius quietus]
MHYCTVCSKGYPRPQELRRHKRDKHGQTRKCPFCCTIWTRPARIRKHVLNSHRSLLSEQEQEAIHLLRGLNDTIRFLAQFEQHTIYAQALGILQPF